MLKGTRHKVDLELPRTDCFRGRAPGHRHGRHFFDDGAGLWQRQGKECRSFFQKINRTGPFIQIDIGGQQSLFDVGWNRIEVVGRG